MDRRSGSGSRTRKGTLREYRPCRRQTPEQLTGPAIFVPAKDKAGLLAQAGEAAVKRGIETLGEDVVGLRSLLLYGLKGVAAYSHHAAVLGQERDDVFAGIECALNLLAEMKPISAS